MCRKAEDAPSKTFVHGLTVTAKNKPGPRRSGPHGPGQIGLGPIFVLLLHERLVERGQRRFPHGLQERHARGPGHVLTQLRLLRGQQQVRRRLHRLCDGKLDGPIPLDLQPVLKSVGILLGQPRVEDRGGGDQRGPLYVVRVGHGEEEHDCSVWVLFFSLLYLFGVPRLHAPRPHGGAPGQVVLGGRPDDEEGGPPPVLRHGRGPAAPRRPSLIVLAAGGPGPPVPEHIFRELHGVRGGRPPRSPAAGKLLELLLPVGEVAGVAEGTVALHEVLAEAHFVKFVGLGGRPALLDPVLSGLHLGEAQREVGHEGQLAPRTPDVLVATEIAVDAETLRVKHTFQPVGFRNVPKRTVLQLTPVAVAAQGHLAQVELVEKFAGVALHAQVAEPVPTNDRAEAGIVLRRRHRGDGLIARGEHAARLAVGEGVDRLGDPAGEGVRFEIVRQVVRREGRGVQRRAGRHARAGNRDLGVCLLSAAVRPDSQNLLSCDDGGMRRRHTRIG
mmetsp:Transcript_35039/g.81034  ORF Transcript_35039/g.81034 Transcript_35039/m.81034 type:complete len:500 (+) Transcript_35039:644-2143(+)